jgi:hypothetical protein
MKGALLLSKVKRERNNLGLPSYMTTGHVTACKCRTIISNRWNTVSQNKKLPASLFLLATVIWWVIKPLTFISVPQEQFLQDRRPQVTNLAQPAFLPCFHYKLLTLTTLHIQSVCRDLRTQQMHVSFETFIFLTKKMPLCLPGVFRLWTPLCW